MNTENVSGDQKRDWKRKLLPLLALIVGLGMPVYAFAASEAECNWCHNTCTNNFQSAMGYCQLVYYLQQNGCGGYYECMLPYYACVDEAVADYSACHTTCEVPGGPCVE